MPCDHLIDEESNFIEAVQKSSNQESSDYITLFGLYPENPNVGFGYITADNNGFVENFKLEDFSIKILEEEFSKNT